MKSRTVLLVGCGDIGIRAGEQLLKLGAQVTGVRRRIENLPAGFAAHAADYTEAGSLDFAQTLQPDYVITTFNPFDRSDQGYRRGFVQAMDNLLAGLGAHRPRRILMSSSTRVFAEADGGWVDESSALSESDPWARSIIEAEQRLLASGHRASIVRFGGIYGIPGGRLIARVSRGEIAPPQPVRFTNRIHRQDCSRFLVHLLEKAEQQAAPGQSAAGDGLQSVYIGVDDYPAPRYEVESWLAEQLGATPLPHTDNEPVRHNSGHKRCRNVALRASGYRLLYPDYRAGYAALLR
jgi:nucleoside-diphosphate-sugar epimerase